MNTISRRRLFQYAGIGLLSRALPSGAAHAHRQSASSGGGEHDYFNTLSARADRHLAISMRAKDGGPHDPVRYNSMYPGWSSKFHEIGVKYMFGSDPYHSPQDAAKISIPAWRPNYTDLTRWDPAPVLAKDVGPGDTSISVTFTGSLPADVNANNTHWKIDNEVVQVDLPTGTSPNWTFPVDVRGWASTDPASHRSGTPMLVTSHSLYSQLWMDMGGTDGHTYFLTWEFWGGPECLYANQGHEMPGKMFQLGKGSSIFLQLDWNSHHVLDAKTDLGTMGYLRQASGNMGPNVDDNGPGSTIRVNGTSPPQFRLYPGRWTRAFVFINMNTGSWDEVSYWLADEQQNPVQLYSRLPTDFDNNLGRFRVEYNSSRPRLEPDSAIPIDRVCYVRNFVMLRDISLANVTPLLQKPIGSGRPVGGVVTPPPAAGLTAPRNVRIVP